LKDALLLPTFMPISEPRLVIPKGSVTTLFNPDGMEVDVRDPTASLVAGNSGTSPLVVKCFYLHTNSIPDKLNHLGASFSIRDIDYLVRNDIERYSILKSPGLTSWEAQVILTYAKSRVKSTTQRAIGRQHSFYLEGSLTVEQYRQSHPCITRFPKMGAFSLLKVTMDTRKPFYGKPIRQWNTRTWLSSSRLSPIPRAAMRAVAQNCFEAHCHMPSKGFCFADLKPSNIMLQNNAEPGYATLVDYRATVRIGTHHRVHGALFLGC
jgi:hypothetical protein